MIERIADQTIAYNERKEAESRIGMMEEQLATTKRGIKNVLTAIEQGIITASTKERLQELEAEQSKIEAQIAAARADIVVVSREDLISGLSMFKDGDVRDKRFQARLFDTFLVAVFAYDDELKIVFSFTGDKNTIHIPIADLQEAVEKDSAECSFKLHLAPPKWSQTNQTSGSCISVVMIGGLFVLSCPLAHLEK